jgi:hypothetical protein
MTTAASGEASGICAIEFIDKISPLIFHHNLGTIRKTAMGEELWSIDR